LKRSKKYNEEKNKRPSEKFKIKKEKKRSKKINT